MIAIQLIATCRRTVSAPHISRSSLCNSPWLVVISQAEPWASDKPVRHHWKCHGGSFSPLSNESYQLRRNQSHCVQVCMQISYCGIFFFFSNTKYYFYFFIAALETGFLWGRAETRGCLSLFHNWTQHEKNVRANHAGKCHQRGQEVSMRESKKCGIGRIWKVYLTRRPLHHAVVNLYYEACPWFLHCINHLSNMTVAWWLDHKLLTTT